MPNEIEIPDATPEERLTKRVEDVKKAILAFQRTERVFTWISGLDEEDPSTRQMPVLQATIRGPDGEPMIAEFDTATWNERDQNRIINLLKRNSQTNYGPTLVRVAEASSEAVNEFKRQEAAAAVGQAGDQPV